MTKALRVIKESGADAGFHISVSKSRAYCPSMTPTTLLPLLDAFPLHAPGEGGLVLLGAPLGTETFVKAHLETKIESCARALRPLEKSPMFKCVFTYTA